jgi:hypothetical protein
MSLVFVQFRFYKGSNLTQIDEPVLQNTFQDPGGTLNGWTEDILGIIPNELRKPLM